MIETAYEPSTYEVMCHYFGDETTIHRIGLEIAKRNFTQAWNTLTETKKQDLIQETKKHYGRG